MNFIKNLITITILNCLLLASILQVGAQLNSHYEENLTISALEPTPMVESTPVPTPTPIIIRRRVEVRKPVQKTTALTPTSSIPATTLSPPTLTTPAPQAAQPTSTPPQSTGCIVLIDGISYDVTNFRKMHGGGDIFSCGSDMSASFWSAHGQSTLQKMQRYRL